MLLINLFKKIRCDVFNYPAYHRNDVMINGDLYVVICTGSKLPYTSDCQGTCSGDVTDKNAMDFFSVMKLYLTCRNIYNDQRIIIFQHDTGNKTLAVFSSSSSLSGLAYLLKKKMGLYCTSSRQVPSPTWSLSQLSC